MQEKNKINADMEKYKAEMMKLYNQKRSAAPEFRKEISGKTAPAAEKNCTDKAETEEKMRPPVTEMPCGECSGEQTEERTISDEKCRFPTADELIKMDSSCDTCESSGDTDGESAVQTMAQGYDHLPDTRFDKHMQGNYEQYSDDGDGAFPEEYGEGYIQVEVTDCNDGAPVAGAAVAVLKKINGGDTLKALLTTDSGGVTEAFALEVADTADHKRPYEEYMVTVFKEGYYSVNMLTVPVFDTIRSIQPVELCSINME